jgi:hypothetical protein
MSARDILTEIFNVETPYDDPAAAADLMLSRLDAAGLKIVPAQPTPAIVSAWRTSRRDGQVKSWFAMLRAA